MASSISKDMEENVAIPDMLQSSMEYNEAVDDEWTDNGTGFGILSGTLELVQVKRREWRYPMELPLPPPAAADAPLLHEFSRLWRALRLPLSSVSTIETKVDSLMKSYEPHFTPSESTFVSKIHPSSSLEPRVAVPEAQTFLVTPHIRFTLGVIEPLVCRLLVYDMSMGCRISEEFCFRIPGPQSDKQDCTLSPAALIYVLPTLPMQHLYLVLKVSKVLIGDGDIATAPYCIPDKFASTSEQQKLIDKAGDCRARLGRFQQPLAWGIMPLIKCIKRPMTLYRQRACISEEQRISLLSDAIRGILKEKTIPALCEFDVDDIPAEELTDAKFQSSTLSSSPLPRLKIADPFSYQHIPDDIVEQRDVMEDSSDTSVHCREVQPFCPAALVPMYGMVGSGPVAVSYVNTLYVYPLQLEKCQFRNIAIRVQLLQKEVTAVRGVELTEDAVLRAVYQANNRVACSAYALVGYHQKNPQFEDEIKICLPEHLTAEHHLLFTFYHVHCKKLQPNQPQQEIVGYAALPILKKDGTIVQDGKSTINVVLASVSTKLSASGGSLTLSPGYVDTVRDAVLDSNKMTFTCRTRIISSIHSQDKAVAEFLNPFHGCPRPRDAVKEEEIVNRLMGLSQSSAPNVRYFFFLIVKFVLGYLRYGTSIVRWSAFRTLLSVFEKASWNPRGSLKIHEMDRVLYDFVHIVFDENAIDSPEVPVKSMPTTEHKSVFRALLETWLNVLNSKAAIEENIETKRLSLTYSNVLLQLILKSMAMNLLDRQTPESNDTLKLLPLTLEKHDEVMLERVLKHLIHCTNDTTNGLLIQKEVNRSVAYFCRGVFLVVKNVFPARVIATYVTMIDSQGDANSLRHLWFPFLHILVAFEFFPTVNENVPIEKVPSVKARAWLATAIFDKLLLIIDTQNEHKIQLDAVRLLRRMFAAQVYNERFQSPEAQERIALLYYPLFPRLAHFTTPGKLLSTRAADSSTIDGVVSSEAKGHFELQKELLACVGHLLDSVSSSHLPSLFQSSAVSSPRHCQVHLDFTEAATFYHRVVSQCQYSDIDGRFQQIETASDSCLPEYDEARVHASLALVQRMLEVFLVTESSSATGDQLWRQLLSPDLSASDKDSGLSRLENHLAHRRNYHRRAGGGYESSVLLAAKVNPIEHSSEQLSTPIEGGASTHRSLPRNWSKQYGNLQQRRSPANIAGGEEKAGAIWSSFKQEGIAGEDYEEKLAALQEAVASTALRVLQTAIDQYEAVVRLIEVSRTPRLGKVPLCTNLSLTMVTTNQALVLLGYLTALLFQLLEQASSISELTIELDQGPSSEEDNAHTRTHAPRSCFLVTLLQYLQAFVWRFSTALFAVRLPDLPLFHDQHRIHLILSIAATAKTFPVRHHATMLLSQLFAVCYDQTGSFLLVKAPLLKVLTLVLFPSSSKTPCLDISTSALRDMLDEMRTFASVSRAKATTLSLAFDTQFPELINDLTTKVHASERWRSVFENPDSVHDFEEIEEGIDRVVDDISVHWLLEEKLVWLNALLRLHIHREHFAEAVCCKMAAIEGVQRAEFGSNSMDKSHADRVQQWRVRELFLARSYADQAKWSDKELSICDALLDCFKSQRRFHEYQEMLRHIAALIARLAERQEPGNGQQPNNAAFSFYRVRYAGGCVPTLLANDEFIYKRSKFTSLGEFVSEMKTMLRTKYPQCERVDVIPEPKALTMDDPNPNVIFLRVTTVEEACPEELTRLQGTEATWQVAFKFAVPFTVSSSSAYGKTAEQFKRITFLAVTRPFPCRLNRQRVRRRHEEIRCPIANSMDDILKRCALLRAEIDKENVGKTDLKTLTLVLKGSVDTHVHGGIPEVLDSFLAADPTQLLDAQGHVMSSHDSSAQRHQLANLLVDFVVLCWQCLVISREAFRRSHQLGSSSPSSSSLPPALIQTEGFAHVDALDDDFLPPQANRSLNLNEPSLPLDLESFSSTFPPVSPLQTEFERSFASLVEQIKTKIPFSYSNASTLARLHAQTASLWSTSIVAPSSTSSPALIASSSETTS